MSERPLERHWSMWARGEERLIALDRPRLIGILNVTPDSFSDGGQYSSPEASAEAGLRLLEDGADVLDVGGESTRPGAVRIPANEQIRRVLPVIETIIRARPNAIISIDTTLHEVALAAVNAGAAIVNDVAAGTEDDRILSLAADHGCGLVLMHRLLPPDRDSYSHRYARQPAYDDVVCDVTAFLASRVHAARQAGVTSDSIVIDPGLGFGKSVPQNYELIQRFSEFESLGYPVLCAASRKSFIGVACGVDEPARRDSGSIGAAVAALFRGIRLFRVHDVAGHRQALAVAYRILQESPQAHDPC